MRPSAGDLDFFLAVWRGLRTNWLIVGIQFLLSLFTNTGDIRLMALAGWCDIDTKKPASLSAYGLDSATPPRVYTFSAEHAACTHSNHRLLRKEETLSLF